MKVKEKHREIPIIGFQKGAGHLYKKFIDETAVDGVSIDSTVDLLWVKQNIQPHCVVQGNLDNMLLLAGGAQLESSVKEILYHLNDGPFIFNLGHGVLPETPVSHVKKLLELVRQR